MSSFSRWTIAADAYLGLTATDAARPYTAGLVEAGEYLGDTAVRDKQLSGDVTGSNSQ